MFLASSALQFAISMVGVIIFLGLTAYDIPWIKEIYGESDSSVCRLHSLQFGCLRHTGQVTDWLSEYALSENA
jgi:uncharacterized protein